MAGHAGEVPLVSVIMANHRGAAHLAAAMASVLAQSESRLELILADTGRPATPFAQPWSAPEPATP